MKSLHLSFGPAVTGAVLLGCLLGPVSTPAAGPSQAHGGQDRSGATTAAAKPAARPASSAVAKLPSLPAGVTELKFGDFFVRPVGPRGLELTDKLRALDGQRVRLLGYMVREETPVPGRLLLAPLPAEVHSHDNALADDLPPTLVHVFVPSARDRKIPHSPGLMLLTGTLSLGGRDEHDGRISFVRLLLDPPTAGRRTHGSSKGAQLLLGPAQ